MCTPAARVLLSRSAAEVQLPAAASPAMPLTAEIARPQRVRAERLPAVMTISPVGARETETCSCAVRGSQPNVSLQNCVPADSQSSFFINTQQVMTAQCLEMLTHQVMSTPSSPFEIFSQRLFSS